MANAEKFIDRSPCLPAAGVASRWSRGDIQACLVHEGVTEDERVSGACPRGPLEYRLPPAITDIYRGYDTDMRRCLQPEAEHWLTGELRDTVYGSYWRLPLGRVADQTPGLPPGERPLDRCYGRPSEQGPGAGELVSPQKTYSEVMAEAAVGHDLYRQTHGDYQPGERVSRGYGEPYREGLVWGRPTPCDPQGHCVRAAMAAHPDRKVLVSKVLADHRLRTRPLVGEVLAPNANAACVPDQHAYGRPNRRGLVGAGELLRDCAPSLAHLDLLEELSYVNYLRNQVHHKQPPFSLRDLSDTLQSEDQAHSGRLPLDQALAALARHQVRPNRALFEGCLARLNVLREDGQVDYEKMLDLLNVNVDFPEIPQIKDVPDELLHFETTNELAHSYHCSERAAQDERPAGSAPRPHVDIHSLLSPSTFSNYGLQPGDWFVPRSRQAVRRLFPRLDDDSFSSAWALARNDQGCASVQCFLTTLNSMK